jgi:thymidylate synthase/dihydrofolate reductase
MINLVACVTNYKNKLALGRHGQLLFKLKDDIKFFKNLTINSLSSNSGLKKNIVLMGRKTYFSIPIEYRPLKDRINIVLTRDPELVKLSPVPKNLELVNDVYYTDLNTFKRIYYKYNPNVFVIGGCELYNTFLNQADSLYITQVQTEDGKDVKFIKGEEPDIFMNHFTSDYKLIGMSEKYKGIYKDTSLSYRILYYKLSDKMSEEYKYLHFMNNILENGNERSDRTGTGTISVFGTQMKFDISQSIPLLTTKRIPFKTIVEELLWFCRGDSDAKILQEKGIKIWNGNTSRDFLDNRGLFHYPEGIIGPQYGFLWRHFGAKYSHSFGDTSQCDPSLIGGFDQLKYVEDLLKNDPFSRRIMISAWSPDRLSEQVLPSCFPAGTLVLTDNGYKNIEDVLITDKLFTHKGNWKNIVNLQQKEYNDEIYEFKLIYNSKKIKTTKEHPFLVKDIIRESDGTIRNYSKIPYWCEAKNITKNHIMCLPINKNKIIPLFNIKKCINQYKNENINKSIETENEWFMLGYYIRDGWIDLREESNKLYFVINKEQKYLYNKISTVLNLHNINDNETKKVNQYSAYNTIWCEIVKDFGHLSHNKKIPEWVQDAPKQYIEWFIEGYQATDVCKTEKSNGVFTTVSADLAYGLQRLYAKLGKILSVDYQITPTTLIEDKTVNTYSMTLHKNGNVLNIDEDYLYYNVIVINKYVENIKVYNFEVEDDNSYTVQNIAVHNCHFNIQFYVTEEHGERYLSCMFIMRSNDFDTANNYNCICYTLLTYILAKRHNMKPKELIYVAGDTHIYKNHIEQVKEQCDRTPRPFPKVVLNDSIKYKDWSEMTVDDFDLVGYFPHPTIKIPMAI